MTRVRADGPQRQGWTLADLEPLLPPRAAMGCEGWRLRAAARSFSA